MIEAISNQAAMGTSGLAPAGSMRDAGGFDAMLHRLAEPRATEAGREARQAAEQLVASAMLMPLLAEVRDQPLDAKLFHGGYAEEPFRQQLDTLLADRIVRSGKFPLVDRIEAQLTRRAGSTPGGRVNVHG